jgi:hypothetical protein
MKAIAILSVAVLAGSLSARPTRAQGLAMHSPEVYVATGTKVICRWENVLDVLFNLPTSAEITVSAGAFTGFASCTGVHCEATVLQAENAQEGTWAWCAVRASGVSLAKLRKRTRAAAILVDTSTLRTLAEVPAQ